MSETIKLADIQPDPNNANKGTERGTYMIRRSLEKLGAGRSIVLDKNGRIIAGNKTAESAADVGIEDVIVVRTKGNQLVAVMREDLDLDDPTGQARELAYADNRAGQVSLEWDADVLSADIAAGVDLGDWFQPLELEAFGLEGEPDEGGGAAIDTGESVYSQEQIIDAAFEWFRANGFPYRNLARHVSMQEINKLRRTDGDTLINSDVAYHVADTYHPHRFHAAAEGMKSPYDSFLDDVSLRRAMSLNQEYGYTLPQEAFGQLWIVAGTQWAANFRPAFAAHLYRRYCPDGATVLDTSTGYGGRLVGFIGSGRAGFYIGIDPNKATHDGNLRMADELLFSDKIELHNLPAEDVPHDVVAGRCDFAFTSPPYFRKEHYSDDDTQSWKRYPTGDEWRDGFLTPMMALQYAALKPGSYSIVNIADVKIKSKVYPLVEWTKAAANTAGFDYVRTDKFPLTRRFGAGMTDEVSIEPVLVFRKSEN